MDYRSIIGQAQDYVRTYFDTHADGQLIYHNLYHTEQVVKAATQIARHYNLNETDLFIKYAYVLAVMDVSGLWRVPGGFFAASCAARGSGCTGSAGVSFGGAQEICP
jgi:hypothetical protein